MMMLRSHTLWMMLLGWLLCLSPVWAQTATIHYVTADGKPLPTDQGYQEAWTTKNVTDLQTALNNAKAGDEVWIKGYEMGAGEGFTVYSAPEGGFKVKSGVKVYGGFSGKETSEANREIDGQVYRMRYRTVLTGDTGGDLADVQDPVNYIFPTSTMNNRADNRTHVVDIDMTPSEASGNDNKEPTVLNGMVIVRGHADGPNEVGGGVYIHGNNTGGGIFRLERCFFSGNYGTMGGAVYVAEEVKNDENGSSNLIDRCSFFNNAAGERANNENRGAAICILGQGYVFNSTIYNNTNGGVIATGTGSAIVNCTITRNTGAGVDGYGASDIGQTENRLPVYNSVVWGNYQLSTATKDKGNFPNFQYSAFPEAGTLGLDLTEGGNNVVLSDKNNDPGSADKKQPKGPSFILPSVKIGYDVDFNVQKEAYPQWNWEPLEETSLVDKGSNDLYKSIDFSASPNVDLNRHERILGTSIDIGAYEFQPLDGTRRRYVMETAQGNGDGTSWENASNDLQKMIDQLAATDQLGEVWVAGGTYQPKSSLIEGVYETAAFRMRDGISVYGGFLGGEQRKDERPAMQFPWEPGDPNSIVYLTGYSSSNTTDEEPSLSDNRWNITSGSMHVVWFAPDTYKNPNAPAFKYPTILDRVCVRRGNASGTDISGHDYQTAVGGGVYMNDANAYMRNCVVKESTAQKAGGGVYLKNGRIIGSLIYNCNAGHGNETGDGGGVYVDEVGMVLRSMVTNNTADRGAGVFLNNADGILPNYLVLSTSLISSNTARKNGGVYCHKGGVLTQNTLTNNYCPIGRDVADKEASETGGVYIDTYGMVINSVIWNNKINLHGQNDLKSATDIPVYVKNPSANVSFLYNAISGQNNAIWNEFTQQGTLALGDKNSTTADQIGPDFDNNLAAAPGIGEDVGQLDDSAIEQQVGAQGNIKWIRYYWHPRDGSNLWAAGMPIGQFPDEVLMSPELDITAHDLYDQKPSIGAFQVNSVGVEPEKDEANQQLVFYVDGENIAIDGNGSSWEKANRSISEVINYYADLTKDETHGIEKLLIRVKGQELWPRFAFSNDDPKTATVKIPATQSGLPIVIEGSWQVNADGRAERNPLQFRTILNGNHDGRKMEDGNYHGVNIDPNAKVELDGFHIINGYAAANSTASIQSGAGVLAKAGSEVTLRNCILENNTAKTAAAVDARQANSLTMVNCVVNNNTNDDKAASVIGVPTEGNYSFDHLTVVNNKGAAPAGLKAAGNMSNSFAAGNTHSDNDTHSNLQTRGEEGAANFTNPTNNQGANLGFDTYLGGYSEFRPLTSSEAAGSIINKGKAAGGNALTTDITMVRSRDLGGIPDLGAFEADLPAKGRVYYVRTPEAGGNDSHDGQSWETAFATIRKAMEAASKGEIQQGEKPQVWVAAGTYRQDPTSGSINCFEILEGVNVFGAFPKTGTPGMGDRHPFVSNEIFINSSLKAEDYETILMPESTPNNNSMLRVLGQSDFYNPYKKPSGNDTYEEVGAGNGNYIFVTDGYELVGDKKGDYIYVASDSYVEAPSSLATHFYAEETGLYKYFETHEEVAAESYSWTGATNSKNFVKVGSNIGSYTITFSPWGRNTWTKKKGPYEEFTEPKMFRVDGTDVKGTEYKTGTYHEVNNGGNRLFVKANTYTYVSKGYGNYQKVQNKYVFVGEGKGNYRKHSKDHFNYPTTWDGFTIKNGQVNGDRLKYCGNTQGNDNKEGKREGGAGVAIYSNVTLKNAIVTNCLNRAASTGSEIRGGGVYCDQGTLVNCYIKNNTLGQASQYTAYGGGVYLYTGTMYNCVINDNKGIGQHTDGAGIFIESGKFFNNTVVGNTSEGTTRGNGGICVYYKDAESEINAHLVLYNCISVSNYNKRGDLRGNADVALNGSNSKMKSFNCIYGAIPTDGGAGFEFNNCKTSTTKDLFVDSESAQKNFRLKSGCVALNMGEDEPIVDGEHIVLLDYTDMDFTDRIKDCRVDAGAYESANEANFGNQANGDGKVLTYYVTQTGAGTSSGDSPENAACAMKLQRILDHAGKTAKDNKDKQVVVKVAGYPGYGFVYHANTLSDPKDPQSYTFVVPYGVTLMGGYNEGHLDDNTGKMVDHNWDDDHRNAAEYMTVLSAIKKGTTTQDVNGYHALTFGEKPKEWGVEEMSTIVDGFYLEDGAATSLVPLGDDRTRGGGTIVPHWAHLRNCVVRNNQARQGGGLYVLPGGLVTGCGILQNTATYEGGGVFADNAQNTVTPSNRGHLISNTIVENTAATGGGIYLEDGAALTVNTVIWGNKAGADKNVSGVTSTTFEDIYFTGLGEAVPGNLWYPFNNCFVEQMELLGNFKVNDKMTAEKDSYFGQFFTLKPYSVLLDKGMISSVQEKMRESYGLAAYDMQGISRLNNPNYTAETDATKPIDVGAYAYTGGVMSTDHIVKRLFVSTQNDVIVASGKENEYMGRSFFTSFSSLEDAFDYINALRQDATNGAAARETTFEILVAAGTYKPSRMRSGAAITVYDQRLNSFVIPYNVEIYGGFTGYERISSDGLQSIELADGSSISLEPNQSIDKVCQRGHTDFNLNGLKEPWELGGQTILSGQLDLTTNEQNAYHVVYSEKDTSEGAPEKQRVLLDGVTIMRGVTHHSLQKGELAMAETEVGRGGGIFSRGVEYALANSRLLENKAVRGGGVFVWDADLYLFNNLVAGNYAKQGLDYESTSFGGGAFVAATAGSQATEVTFRLRAINNLFVNNQADNMGGALAAGNPNKTDDQGNELKVAKYSISSFNNTIVRNKAEKSPVIFNSNGESFLTNTLLWGNEGLPTGEEGVRARIGYCASDVDYHKQFSSNQNHLLDKENLGMNGPRFNKPSEKAGVDGYDSKSLWNPIALSLATDNGHGMMTNKDDGSGNMTEEDSENKNQPNYKNFWENIPDIYKRYKEQYNDVDKKDDESGYNRYSGPVEPGTNKVEQKPIDIGFYEYQYYTAFSAMQQIYVAEISSGNGSGESWTNATDDLRGAIMGAANPTQNETEHRTIYVKEGNYASLALTSSGAAFPINTKSGGGVENLNLTIKGACTGTGHAQDFSKPSYITVHPQKQNETKQLMDISVSSAKTVTLEGFCFTNPGTGTGTDGIGVNVSTVTNNGQVVLRQTALRGNRQGVNIGTLQNGKFLAVNTLFADNATGLANGSGENITLVNTTFANNTEADMSKPVTNTFNSVSWNNTKSNMPADEGNQNANVSFREDKFENDEAAAANNADVLNGPNFRDPLNTEKAKRDYRIRPSQMLLDKGDNELYTQHALGLSEPNSPIPETEKDLYSTSRKVGDRIDIGAYEYEAQLQPIVYVNSTLATGTADGSSWDNATRDLQGAVDLAGVYANNNSDKQAYVFADRNVKPMGTLRITLPNVKVYGGMNGEVHLVEVEDGKQEVVSQPTDQIEAATIVGGMLQKRAGLLMQTDRSTLQVLQLEADAVVDGFEIAQGAEVNQGTLATSIVGSTNVGTAVTGKTDGNGTLYNSLVYGNVSGVKAVNVTATGTITDAIQGSGNNRAEVSEANKYVETDHWKYQLNETDTDNLNKGTVNLGSLDTPASIIASVGHNRDLIGNRRVRNEVDKVDNGCFETWYLPEGGTVTKDDYPLGQSVVYVGSGKELLLDYPLDETFSPGFLLLEHQAGLRGNGNKVELKNFAVERLLPQAEPATPQADEPAAETKVYDLAVMPFMVTKAEGLADDKVADGAKLYSYDSKARASFAYKFDKEKGAWTDTKHTDQRERLTIGWLIEGEPGTKVRFYGTSYEENGQSKSLDLKMENHNQPWKDPSDKGEKFTHKENMSWNLFGSPYLCAMKYADMGYGRMMYGMPDHGDYVTVQTYNAENDDIVDGYIPAGDAVFTQTATLKEYEVLSIAQPAETNALSEGGIPYAGQQALQVALTRTLATRNDAAADEAADVLQLRAVDEAEARTDFDLGSDGVKWSSPNGVPQIYALQNSGRYSLLSAVNREGSVQVGVQLPAAGNYRFFLPEECDLTDYEVVMLHDAQTGQSTDLTEGAYAFSTVEGGDVEARFTLSFVRKDSPLTQGIRVRRLSERSFRIEGTQPGDQIRLFGTDGRQVAAQTASAATETVEAYLPVTAIVEVKRNGRPVGVVKVR